MILKKLGPLMWRVIEGRDGRHSLGTSDDGEDEEREKTEEEGGDTKANGVPPVLGASVESLGCALGEAVGHANAKVLDTLVVLERAKIVLDALVNVLSPGVRTPVQASFTLLEELGALSILSRAFCLALGDRIPGLYVEGKGVGLVVVQGRGVIANGGDAIAGTGSVANVCPSSVDHTAHSKNEGQRRASDGYALAHVDALGALPLALLRLDHTSRLPTEWGCCVREGRCPPEARCRHRFQARTEETRLHCLGPPSPEPQARARNRSKKITWTQIDDVMLAISCF